LGSQVALVIKKGICLWAPIEYVRFTINIHMEDTMKSIKCAVIFCFVVVFLQIAFPLFSQSFAWYSQRDPAWASNRLGSTAQTVSNCTIGNYGCAMTSVAMLLQQESSDATSVTPASLNTYLTNNSGYQYSGGYALIVWSVAAQMDGSAGLTYYDTNSVDDNWTYLDTQLAAGRKVIVQVDMYPATAPIDEHWVVVYEKSGPSGQPSSYYINDPWPTSFPSPQRTLAYYYDPTYDNTFFESRVFGGNFSSSSGSISMVSGYPLSVYPTRTNPSTAYFLPIEYQSTTPPDMDKNLAINFKITNSGSSSITLWNFGVDARADNSSGANVFYCNYDQSITLSAGQQVTFNKRAFITDQWNNGSSRNFYFHVTYQDDGGTWHSIPGTSAETNRTVYPRPSMSNSMLAKAPNNPAVYYHQNDYKWQLSSESTADALIPNWQTECYVYPTTTISSLSLPQTPSSNSTTPVMVGRNFVFKNPSTADIYIIEPEPGYSSPFVRRRFDSETAWDGYGYTSGSLSQLPVQLTSAQYSWVTSQYSLGSTIYPPSYSVNVTSSPSGVSIYVDGSNSGYSTPHSFSLTQGSSATFTVQQSGYTWTPPSFPVTNISSNQSVNFVGTLQTFSVNITSSPTDADIYVNGSDSGYNSPHTFTLNYGASATYTMQKTGYSWSPTQFTVTNIQSNQSQYFTGTLSVPGAAILSAPSNGATGLSYASQTLTWSAGTGNAPTGYKVYFGTANPPTSLVSTQTGLSYPTGALSPSSTYYWKVVAYNGTGDAPSSSIWNFTTASVSSFNVNITSSPSDAAIFVGGSSSGFNTPHTFSLTQGSSATYSVQLAGYTWVPTNFTVTNIQANTSQNFVGTLSVPGAAVLSSPSNSATGLSYASQTLVWTAGSGNPPTGYKVYLGTANPPTSLVSTQTELTYTTTLNPSTTYYWKVVAFNGTGEAPSSSIWSFSTVAQTILPNLTAFQINNGAESTTSVNVVLNITASEATHYMASENPEFSGASWLTYSASPSFTLSASPGLKTVYLKVKNANAESGTLSDQITLTSAQPLWTPITGNQYSAIGFFNVHIDGVLFTGDNGLNLLGAFNAAEECLGVGYWQSNLFYMDILNNNNGSTVYFKIYDGSNDEILSCNETLVFTDNEVYGTPESPVSLNVTTSVSLTYNLVTGWNWISIPIQFSNPSPANVFASLGSSIQTVKTQTQSAIRSTNGTWYGTLTTITGLSSYLVQMNSGATLTLSGYPIALETQIGLVTNWNWPAYLPTTSGITVPTAFSSLIPNVYIVKTQNQSKMYSTSTSQWIGSLSSVNPGQGIKVQMTAADNLIYQSSKISELAQSGYLESNGYPDNMILHAQLFDKSMHPINLGEYEVCFVDNSNIVHGIGEEVSVNGSSFVYSTIGGSSDDTYLIPCIKNIVTGQKYYAVPIAFVPDEIIGSYDVPSQIFFDTLTQVGVDEQVYSYPQVKVIPNPILNQGKIYLSNFAKGSDDLSIDIYDIRGRIIKHYQSVDQPEIEIPSEIPSGIYFVRVKSASLKYTAKFTKIK